MERPIVNSSSHFQFLSTEGNSVTTILAAPNDRLPKFTFWNASNSLSTDITFLDSDAKQCANYDFSLN